MKKSTQKWLGIGLIIAVLFFSGALLVMLLTDEAVEEDGQRGDVEQPHAFAPPAELTDAPFGSGIIHPTRRPEEG